ncbi:MAG TPA: hypothetical protein PKE29_00945 [Phycisphaerales bacterium]|nr:hypothetical protein [Phycisphaerales bacterium]
MTAAAAAETPPRRWGRIVLVALAIAAAVVLLVGYGVWAITAPWMRSVADLPAADNASGAIAGIQTSVGYAPPAGARLIWSRNDSGWGGDQTREWILFLPPGTASKQSIIEGIGQQGTEFGPADTRAAEFIAGYLSIRSVGTPQWSYNSGQWNVKPKGSAEVDVVETEQGVCIYVKLRTAR